MDLLTALKATARKRLGRTYEIASEYKMAVSKHIALWSLRRQLSGLSSLEKPFFVVGIPGSLHIIDLCLSYVPSDIGVVLVSNGMEAWEQSWARQHLNIRSIVVTRTTVEHGALLDCLFDQLATPFGILDYDCFIFDSTCFSQLKDIAPQSMLNALFCFTDRNLNIEFPMTFVLFFNTEVIRALRRTYRVSCGRAFYSELRSEVKEQISVIGVDKYHLPEDFKGGYFDTLRLVLLLGLATGYGCNFIEKLLTYHTTLQSRALHVGGVTSRSGFEEKWNLRGAYFWRRALETHSDSELRRRYLVKYGDTTASQLLAHWPISREIEPEFLSSVECIVRRERPPFRGQLTLPHD